MLLAGTMIVPRALRAQQKAMPVIGYLHYALPGSNAPNVVALHQGLREAGYVEGQNVAIEYRWAEIERNIGVVQEARAQRMQLPS